MCRVIIKTGLVFIITARFLQNQPSNEIDVCKKPFHISWGLWISDLQEKGSFEIFIQRVGYCTELI